MSGEYDLVESLLIEGEECLGDGDPEGALQAAEELLQLDSTVADAHHLRALALRELDRPEEALGAVERAVSLAQGLAEAAFTQAELLTFDMGEPGLALDICDHYLREDLEDTLYADFLVLKGNALCELADFKAALACFERANELSPDRDDPGSRGWALFELGRFVEAIAALRESCQPGPASNPANHLYLAVALVRQDEPRAAAKHFRIAARQDPDLFHVPQPLPEGAIIEVYTAARQALPPALSSRVEGVSLRVEPWPVGELLGEHADSVSPLALIHVETSPPAEPDVDPSAETIVLYERNASFLCPDIETLREELQVALWRELLHVFQLKDEDLEALGLH